MLRRLLRSRALTAAIALCLCALASPPALTAQQGAAAKDSDEYRDTIAEALSQYERGYFSEAHASFQRAHALNPNARTHWGLGVTAFEGRRYVEALQELGLALASSNKPLTKSQREASEKLIERARGYVASFRVALSPAEARVVVDGVRTLDATQAKRLLLDPGEHELVASAEGYETLSRRVRVQSGDDKPLELTLKPTRSGEPLAQSPAPAPAAVAAASPAAPPAATPAAPGRSRSVGPYLVMGTGAAVLVGALVTGILTKGVESDLLEACGESGPCQGDAHDADIDKGNTLKTTTNVLLGVGAATVAGGLLWFLLDPGSARESSATEASFACLRDGCSARLRGHF